jgi:hypothetical protein
LRTVFVEYLGITTGFGGDTLISFAFLGKGFVGVFSITLAAGFFSSTFFVIGFTTGFTITLAATFFATGAGLAGTAFFAGTTFLGAGLAIFLAATGFFAGAAFFGAGFLGAGLAFATGFLAGAGFLAAGFFAGAAFLTGLTAFLAAGFTGFFFVAIQLILF